MFARTLVLPENFVVERDDFTSELDDDFMPDLDFIPDSDEVPDWDDFIRDWDDLVPDWDAPPVASPADWFCASWTRSLAAKAVNAEPMPMAPAAAKAKRRVVIQISSVVPARAKNAPTFGGLQFCFTIFEIQG
jgi:hypothetical protein